jgi:hypothetical protein
MADRNIAILAANSVHARLLLRDHDTGDFKTRLAIDNGPSVPAVNPRGSTIDERLRRQRIGAFVKVIASHVRDLNLRHPMEGLIVIAPARMTDDLAAAIGDVVPVLARAPKNLLKTPDHEMAAALKEELFAAQVEIGRRPNP